MGTSALKKGQGVCYNRDYGTATSIDGGRDKRVELPSQSNNANFAGVCARDYSAASVGSQQIEIFEPGSVCEIAAVAATTVNSTRLTCTVLGASGTAGISGVFGPVGFGGRGTAVALQTISALASTTTSPGIVASSTDGTASVDAAGTTITDTGEFAYAAAGDRLLVVGGKATSAAATAVTVGEYTVASRTDNNTIVVDSAMCSAASIIAYYLIRGNPTVLAYLEDGAESGCVEYISSIATGAATTAHTTTTEGFTLYVGGETALGDGTGDDFTVTLANGAYIGQRKGYKLLDGIGSQGDILITVTNGLATKVAGSSIADQMVALQTMELDASSDSNIVEWMGTHWFLRFTNHAGLT